MSELLTHLLEVTTSALGRVRVWGDSRFSSRALVTLLAIPVIVMLIGFPGRRYVPIGDEASILYRVQEIGTTHTPLVGVYSTRGWAHPGPFLYYLLAIPYRLSGGQPIAVFAATCLLGLASLLLACYFAYRRRGRSGLLVAVASAATLLYGLHAGALLEIWNPYVSLMPYFAFCFALWGIAERDFALTPAAVLLGSAIVQLHIGYLPLVAVGALSVGGWLVVTRRGAAPLTALSRRGKAWTAGLTILLWLPPLIDLCFGDRNALHVLRYFGRSQGETSGLSYGLGLLSGHVKLTGPWSGGAEPHAFLNLIPEALASLLILAGLLALLAVLNARGRRPGAAMPVVALGQLAAGAIAAAKLQPPYLAYLIVWMFPLAAFCWAAVALSAFDLASGRTRRAGRLAQWVRSPAVAVILIAFTAVQTVRTCAAAWRPPLPRQNDAVLVSTLIQRVKSQVPARALIRVEGVGDAFNDDWVGILYGLAQRDQPFVTSDGSAGQKWGTTHRWNGQRVAETVTIASDNSGPGVSAVSACEGDPGETAIATAASRAHTVVVFTGDHVCGG